MDAGNSTTWHGPCKRTVLATKFRAYEPNSIMIVSTFEEDLLGLKEFANRLDKFIATEQKFRRRQSCHSVKCEIWFWEDHIFRDVEFFTQKC